MNEQELRAVVRAAIQKQMGASASAAPGPLLQEPSQPEMVPTTVPFGSHASHFLYMQLVNDNGGQCLIESKVPCNHCGYCQSHGH